MPLNKSFTRLLLLLLLSCSSPTEQGQGLPESFRAKVIKVIDGDTIDVLYNEKPLRIRLAHIDCPEIKKGQPYNKAAKQFVSDLCFGREVEVLNNGEYDRWGRLVGVIINDKKQNVNKEILMAGLGWHYKKYSSDTSYANLEIKARDQKIGLWKDEKPVPPWEWKMIKKGLDSMNNKPSIQKPD